jgi:tight adherence protein B
VTGVPIALSALGAAFAVLGLRSVVAPTVSVGGPRASTPPPPWVVRALAYLAVRVERAGIPVPTIWIAVGGIAAVGVFGVLVGAVMASVVAGGAAAVGLGCVAHAVLGGLERRYPRRVAEQFPGVSRHLADGLGAGLSFRQALDRAAVDAPEPARSELAVMSAELALGARSGRALEAFAVRVPHPDVEMLTCAVLVHGNVGGNLARVLGDLSERLDDRARLAKELRGATAQARMTAWLVGALPVAGAVVLEIAAPGTLRNTLGEGLGLLISAVATAMFVFGLALIRRLGQVEP